MGFGYCLNQNVLYKRPGKPLSVHKLNGMLYSDANFEGAMLACANAVEEFKHALFISTDDEACTYLEQMGHLTEAQKIVVLEKEPSEESIIDFFGYVTLKAMKAVSEENFSVEVGLNLKTSGLYRAGFIPAKVINVDPSIYSKPDECFDGFHNRYALVARQLLELSLAKFDHHRKKLDWRDNPKKLSLDNLFKELQDEVDELRNYTDDRNFDEELGDILNYLVILKDIKDLKKQRS